MEDMLDYIGDLAQNEQLDEYIYSLINGKALIEDTPQSIGVYEDAFYFDGEILYDEVGDILLKLEEGFINDYSHEDIALSYDLQKTISKKIERLDDIDTIVLI